MPMSDTPIIERLRWQKRYTHGIVPVTMEDAAKEIERLRAQLDQALRQWKMYAEMQEDRDLVTEKSVEGDMYRSALSAISDGKQP